MTEYGGERQTTGPHVSDPAAGHERSDVNIGPLVAVAVILTVVVIIVFAAMWLLMVVFERTEQRTDAALPPIVEAPAPPAGPPLQPTFGHHETMPYQDVIAMRKRDAEVLASAGWVDREQGIARIPITDAMTLLLERRPLPATRPTTQEAQP